MVESAAATTGSTVSPDDSAAALRFGWILAEVKGRFDPAADQTVVPNPAPPAMLLDSANERSAVERQVEAVKILAALSQGGTTDMPMRVLSRFKTDWAQGDGVVLGLTASNMLLYLASRLIWSRTGLDLSGTLGALWPIDTTATERSPEAWWDRLVWFLWAWDEAIQDQFAAQTFGTASSYQLGRGLAETYWALDPSEGGAAGWGFLLGPERVDALCENTRRLTPIIGALTAEAVASTVRSWGVVAADPGAYVDPKQALQRQTIVWRDLLVTGRNPMSMVDSHDLAKVARRPWPLLISFAWEIGLFFVGALLIGLAIVYLGKFSAALFSALGAVGITVSALVGWAKSTVQKVTDRVRASVDSDAVVKAVQRLPKELPKTKPMPSGTSPAGTNPPGASQSPPPPGAAPGTQAA